MTATTTEAGLSVGIRSQTPCPKSPKGPNTFTIYAPQTYIWLNGDLEFDDPNVRTSWHGKIFTYVPVADDPLNPVPVTPPGNYTYQMGCMVNGDNFPITQTYLRRDLRVTPARPFAAPAAAHRGTTIHLSGSSCPVGTTVFAGILGAKQSRDYGFNDPHFIKYFASGAPNSAQRWNVAVPIAANAPLGTYIARAECHARDGSVTRGFATRALTVSA